MTALTDRFNYLFRSTKGLILVAIALIAIVTAVWGMLSGPLKEWGISAVAIQLYGMKLVEAEREARIILLYHTIAMAVVAIETYLITALVPMKPHQQANINATITVGYITSLVFGLWFRLLWPQLRLPRPLHHGTSAGLLRRAATGGRAVAVAQGVPRGRPCLCAYARRR